MGGQCPGARSLKGAPRDREKKKKRKELEGGGAPESPLSMDPERPHYATAVAKAILCYMRPT